MEFEFILPLVTVVFSIISLILGGKSLSREKRNKLKQLELMEKAFDYSARKVDRKKDMTKEELEAEQRILKSIRDKMDRVKVELEKEIYEKNNQPEKKVNKKSNQSGKIEKAVITYIVPAIAALALVGLYIYLWVTHGSDPNYSTPEALNSTMSVVVGYLFGATAASNT